MGAAAFLMSEITDIPYVRIIGAAVIPALLYYFGVWAGVHFEAKKNGLRGLTKEELPNLKEIFFKRGYLIIPLVGIVWLLVTGYTPMLAAFYAIILSIASAILGWFAPLPIGIILLAVALIKPMLGFDGPTPGILKYFTEVTPLGMLVVLGVIILAAELLHKRGRISPKDIVSGLESGARGALGVLTATACAGIIIGVVTQTGLGLKLGSVLVDAAHGNLLLTLAFTMVTSIILGMGVPTTANYIITSTIAAPAIIMLLSSKAGLAPGSVLPISIILPAHMFAFYFGIIADITPPVALAAFAGAGIAKANPMKTGINATKLAIAAFLVHLRAESPDAAHRREALPGDMDARHGPYRHHFRLVRSNGLAPVQAVRSRAPVIHRCWPHADSAGRRHRLPRHRPLRSRPHHPVYQEKEPAENRGGVSRFVFCPTGERARRSGFFIVDHDTRRSHGNRRAFDPRRVSLADISALAMPFSLCFRSSNIRSRPSRPP
jgi:hypothetical protein